MKIYDVVIVGAGASGLVAAILASERGLSVCVLERLSKVGKKILATGNGRCNMTNLAIHNGDYRSENRNFPYRGLEQVSVNEALHFFERLGIVWKGEDGYVYPRTEQAASVVAALELKLQALGVDIFCDQNVTDISKRKGVFCIKTEQQQSFCGTQCILSMGGKAQPKLGSDGSGYEIAKSFGHSIVTVAPALTGLHTNHKATKRWAGVRAEGTLTCIIQGTVAAEETGEIQFTNYGISGVPTFQISRYATTVLEKKRNAKVEISINFYPTKKRGELEQLLRTLINVCGYKNIRELLEGIFSKKLVPVFLEEAGIKETLPCKQLQEKQLKTLCNGIQNFVIPICGSNSFEQAQVCAGGVSTKEVQEQTMESKLIKGLYLTGELLDVDGTCGGYNLQWAWTSGTLAGISVQKQTKTVHGSQQQKKRQRNKSSRSR